MCKRYIYFRVSTEQQSHERQMFRMTEYFARMGMSMDGVEVFSEKITSHTAFTERKLYSLLQKAQEGDIIYVCQLDRLGRTMVDILEMVDFAVKRGIILITIDNGYQLENKTAMGKLYLGMVSAMAEAERELRAERCQAGVDSAIADLKQHGQRITRRGKVQTHWGHVKGSVEAKRSMAIAREAAIKSKQDSVIAWMGQSKAVKFAIRKRAEGWTLQQIADELGHLYDDDDSEEKKKYGTPAGCKPSKGTISKWLRWTNPIAIN